MRRTDPALQGTNRELAMMGILSIIEKVQARRPTAQLPLQDRLARRWARLPPNVMSLPLIFLVCLNAVMVESRWGDQWLPGMRVRCLTATKLLGSYEVERSSGGSRAVIGENRFGGSRSRWMASKTHGYLAQESLHPLEHNEVIQSHHQCNRAKTQQDNPHGLMVRHTVRRLGYLTWKCGCPLCVQVGTGVTPDRNPICGCSTCVQARSSETQCSHPHAMKEYYLGADTGDRICCSCGGIR
jgi:hypothetical protein